MPIVHGGVPSPFVKKVCAFLAEKGVAFEQRSLAPFPKSPELLAMNPLGKIPIYQDGELMLPDSSAICAYVERVQPKPGGVRRVVCLGDSFTWGVGILFDDAWPQRVERTLARTRGERWEAVNLAEPGMNAVEYASRLESEGFGYGPDVVVVGWVLNDSEDSDAAEARRARDWAEEERRTPTLAETVLSRSALFRMVHTRVRATIENRRRVTGYLSMYADDYKGWAAARQALQTMGGMCRARGVPFVVAIFPLFANPLDARYPFAELHARVAQAAGEAGAKVVDLLPHYRNLDWHLLVVNGAADEHPNEIAQRIAAQAITRAVDEVVPRPAAHP